MGKRQRTARKLSYVAFFLAASSLVAAQVGEQPPEQQQPPAAGAAPEGNGPTEPVVCPSCSPSHPKSLTLCNLSVRSKRGKCSLYSSSPNYSASESPDALPSSRFVPRFTAPTKCVPLNTLPQRKWSRCCCHTARIPAILSTMATSLGVTSIERSEWTATG